MSWRLFLSLVLAFILLIGVNDIASRHYAHIDISRSHRFSLSDQGSVLFSGIQRPAHIIIYFSPSSLSQGAELYGDVEALMKEYQIKAREHLVIEYLDPARNLGRAREVQGYYKFNPNENVVIIDYSGQTKIIPVKELGEYDSSILSPGETPRLVAFRGEQVINAALIELSGVPLKKVYFLQGHGEKIPGSPSLEIIGRYLQQQHIIVAPLNLASTEAAQELPNDIALLVIAGANYDLLPQEAEVLKNYWHRSGRFLILLDPAAATPLLTHVIEEAGITPRSDRVVRLFPPGNSTTIARDVTDTFIPGSELTKQFLGLNIVFAGTTQSLDLTAASPNNAIQRRSLIEAAPGFWGCTEGAHEPDKDLFFITGKDTAAPLVIAAMADRGALHDDRVAVNAARMVVIGNSDFIQDKNIADIDLDFFSSSLNGLIDRVQLTGNTAKMKAYFTLNLDDEALQQIALWSLIIIPLLGAFIGITIIWRHRS